MRETFNALITHCGGADTVSEPQRMLARRIATLEAVLVYLEDDFAAAYAEDNTPDPTVLALYGTLADRQRRLADPLGWQRTPRDVGTINLAEYVSAPGEPEEGPDDEDGGGEPSDAETQS